MYRLIAIKVMYLVIKFIGDTKYVDATFNDSVKAFLYRRLKMEEVDRPDYVRYEVAEVLPDEE